MIIYCDGGFWQSENLITWGVRAEFGEDEVIEISGSRSCKQNGLHELAALTEAALVAQAHGVPPEQCHVYTDDQVAAYHGKHGMTRNFLKTHDCSETLDVLLKGIARIYSKETAKIARQFAMRANIHWVKGHDFCIGNLRVDYLSRMAKNAADGKPHAIAPFETWLANGFCKFGTRGGRVYERQWYPPFTATKTEPVL